MITDAVTRLLPGVLGDEQSAVEDSFSEGLLDCQHYTRPEEIEGLGVPPVLLSGDHAAIRRWRKKQALGRTWLRRPELLEKLELDKQATELLDEFCAETGYHRKDAIAQLGQAASTAESGTTPCRRGPCYSRASVGALAQIWKAALEKSFDYLLDRNSFVHFCRYVLHVRKSIFFDVKF